MGLLPVSAITVLELGSTGKGLESSYMGISMVLWSTGMGVSAWDHEYRPGFSSPWGLDNANLESMGIYLYLGFIGAGW